MHAKRLNRFILIASDTFGCKMKLLNILQSTVFELDGAVIYITIPVIILRLCLLMLQFILNDRNTAHQNKSDSGLKIVNLIHFKVAHRENESREI